jgi:hypothetical protein
MSAMFDVISEPNKKYDWITFVIFFVDDTIYLIKTQGHYLIYLIFRKLDMRLLKHVMLTTSHRKYVTWPYDSW